MRNTRVRRFLFCWRPPAKFAMTPLKKLTRLYIRRVNKSRRYTARDEIRCNTIVRYISTHGNLLRRQCFSHSQNLSDCNYWPLNEQLLLFLSAVRGEKWFMIFLKAHEKNVRVSQNLFYNANICNGPPRRNVLAHYAREKDRDECSPIGERSRTSLNHTPGIRYSHLKMGTR